MNKRVMSSTHDSDYLFKLVIVGSSSVGKSSLLMRLMDKSFENSHCTTIGADCKMKSIKLGETTCKLQIWDTAGQERYESIVSSFYRGAHGIILVYDVSNRNSFESVTKVWLRQVRKSIPDRNVNMILVANKRDVPDSQRMVARWEGEILAQELNIRYIETSAKSYVNIERIFTSLATDIKSAMGEPNYVPSTSIKLGENESDQHYGSRRRILNHKRCGC